MGGRLGGLQAFDTLLAVRNRGDRLCRAQGQPGQALFKAGPAHGVRLAAAADGGQKLLRRLGRQHKLDLAGRLFQGLEQGVGRDGVHALCRENQHHLGVAARACELREADRFAGSVHFDFFAWFAFFGVQLFLGFLVQRPA